MDFGKAFDGILSMMLAIGVIIGLVIAGMIWLAMWLYGHLQINWI